MGVGQQARWAGPVEAIGIAFAALVVPTYAVAVLGLPLWIVGVGAVVGASGIALIEWTTYGRRVESWLDERSALEQYLLAAAVIGTGPLVVLSLFVSGVSVVLVGGFGLGGVAGAVVPGALERP